MALWKWIIGTHHYAPRAPHVAPHIALAAHHAPGTAAMDPWALLSLVGATIVVGSFLFMNNHPTA